MLLVHFVTRRKAGPRSPSCLISRLGRQQNLPPSSFPLTVATSERHSTKADLFCLLPKYFSPSTLTVIEWDGLQEQLSLPPGVAQSLLLCCLKDCWKRAHGTRTANLHE
ncbi:UNVERIFIED_CONTAM: hypothetical protein K2H54_016694 [Gekko kuhli]